MRYLSLIGFLVSVCLGAAAVPVFAARTEFVAVVNGERVSGASVCFFPASRDDGFFDKFLSSADVRCLPADKIIDMPVGSWNVYVDDASRSYTSNHPTFQSGDYESPGDRQAYRKIDVGLVPAGTLQFGIHDSTTRGAVYVHRANPSLVRPVRPREQGVLVPSDTELLPLLIESGTIVRIGRLATLNHGGTAKAIFDDARAGLRHVVVLMRLPEMYRGDAERFEAPEILLRLKDGREFRPILPPRRGSEIDRSLLVFEGVPNGGATVEVGGRFWKKATIDIPPSTRNVQVLGERLEVEPAGAAIIGWSVPVDGRAPCRIRPDEDAETFQGLRVSRCDGECRVVEEHAPADRNGSIELARLAPGTYRALLTQRYGQMEAIFEVKAAEAVELNLSLLPISITGTVTTGDSPFPSDLVFATGTATTDEAGNYTALLRKAPGRDYVVVVPCNGSAEYHAVPEKDLADRSIFEIEVPSNEIVVVARDAVTRSPLADVRVNISVLSEQNGDPSFFLDAASTDDSGKSHVERIPPNQWIRVCGVGVGVERYCAGDLKVSSGERAEVELLMRSLERREGRVIADGEIMAGILYWITPAGQTTESVHLEADGRFISSVPHAPEEHLVFIARNRPLTAFQAPPRTTEPWQIPIPVAPSLSFTIESKRPSARIALEVGPWLVPEEVFSRFQIMQGEAPSWNDGRGVHVRAIAQTAPVFVLAGPPTGYLPPDLPPTTDLSSLPQYRAVFTRVPVLSGYVTIPE